MQKETQVRVLLIGGNKGLRTAAMLSALDKLNDCVIVEHVIDVAHEPFKGLPSADAICYDECVSISPRAERMLLGAAYGREQLHERIREHLQAVVKPIIHKALEEPNKPWYSRHNGRNWKR